jgi:uncharacterized protein DUF4328
MVGEQGSTSAVSLPYEQTPRLVAAVALCLLGMALVLGFLIESLRADQLTLAYMLADLPVGDIEQASNHGRLVRDTTILSLLGLAVIVMWLVWQYRAQANIRVLVQGTRFHPVAAVGAWLVPVVNLVGPPLAMRELWRASDTEREDWRKAWTTPLLWLWWLLLLTAVAMAGWALAPAWHHGATLDERFVRDHRAVMAGGAGILACVMAAVLILVFNLRVSQREYLGGSGGWRGWADRRHRRR